MASAPPRAPVAVGVDGMEELELPAEEPTSAGGTPVALKLKGSHGVTKEVQPQLIELMKKAGIDPGSWQLPVFFCDELQVRNSWRNSWRNSAQFF